MSGYYNCDIMEWANLCTRILKHKDENRSLPKYGLIGDAQPNMDETLDACLRVGRYLDQNKTMPDKVWIGTKPIETQVIDDGWYRSASFDYNGQDTGYWCAPASVSMATQEQQRTQAESTLASLFGTDTSGTSHEQIRNGLEKIGFSVEEVWVKDMDINRLAQIAKDPHKGCIPHIQLTDSSDYKQSMCYDWTGNKLYQTYRGGHYLFNACVNPSRFLLLNADPARGMEYVWWQQLWYGCRYTEINLGVPGFIIISSE